MSLPPYVFDVDHVAKIRSGLSITVLEKKNSTKLPLKKVTLRYESYLYTTLGNKILH